VDSDLYEEFAAVERDHWWFQGRRAIVEDVLDRWLPPSSSSPRKILDIGCGTGEMLEMLTRFGDVVAMDASEAAVAHCRRRFGDTVNVTTGVVPDDLPVGPSFDLVSAFDVIEHLDDDADALQRLRSVLMPGGTIIVTVPAFQSLWSVHDDRNQHRRRYNAPLLTTRLVDAGFTVRFMSYFNSLMFPAIAAVRLIQRLQTTERATSNVALPPRPVNAGLRRAFAAERALLRRGRLPFGTSIVAVAAA
jgi:SAM-dependent methyltransferase